MCRTYQIMNLSPDRILQTGMGFWASKTLLSAVEMDVFTELAKHPGDLEAVQGRLGLNPRGARDFLDALVALGFLLREEGVYKNAPETDLFMDKAKPSYIGGILEMCNHRLYGFWGSLTTALRTGGIPKRIQRRPRSLQGALCGSGGTEGVPASHVGSQPWCQYGDCCSIPLGALSHLCRYRNGSGRLGGADREGESASPGARL